MAVFALLLGAAALLGGAWFTTSLIASLATPVALLIGAAAGIGSFIELNRRDIISDVTSSDEGEFIVEGLLSAVAFLFVYVVAESLMIVLSPVAGLIVVGLGVAVFVLGPGLIFDLLEVFRGGGS